MATPMKRWFRVADSVTREPWSNDEAALFLRLLGHFNARRSRDRLPPNEASVVVLRPGELCSLAGCQSLARARRILDGLKTHVSLIVDERGAYTSVEWPKLPEFQGWASGTRENAGHDAPQETPLPDSGLRTPDSGLQDQRKNPEKKYDQRGSAEGERTDPPKRAVARSPAPPAAWALRAAEALRESVRRRWPGAPVPDSLVSWSREIARIGASAEAVQDAMRWYVAPARDGDRYVPECRSGRSFREKYDKVLAAMKRAAMPGPSTPQRPEPGGMAYRQFKPERRETVPVVSLLSELRKAVTQ